MSLQGKEEKKKIEVGVARRPNIHPAAVLHRTKKKSLLFAEEDNFQLEGWWHLIFLLFTYLFMAHVYVYL